MPLCLRDVANLFALYSMRAMRLLDNRDLPARRAGKLPKAEFKRTFGMTEKEFCALVKAGMIGCYERHKTLKGWKEYFEWVVCTYEECWFTHYEEFRRLIRSMKEPPASSKYDDIKLFLRECQRRRVTNKKALQEIKSLLYAFR